MELRFANPEQPKIYIRTRLQQTVSTKATITILHGERALSALQAFTITSLRISLTLHHRSSAN